MQATSTYTNCPFDLILRTWIDPNHPEFLDMTEKMHRELLKLNSKFCLEHFCVCTRDFVSKHKTSDKNVGCTLIRRSALIGKFYIIID